MSRARAAVWNLTAVGLGRRQAVTWRRAWTMRERRFDALLMALGATMALSLYFWVLPGVDLAVAEVFHSPETGFALSQSPVLRALRKSSTLALVAVFLTAVILLVRAGLREGWRGVRAARRSWCVLAGLVLGPVLLVNGLLKGQWGRPVRCIWRPSGAMRPMSRSGASATGARPTVRSSLVKAHRRPGWWLR